MHFQTRVLDSFQFCKSKQNQKSVTHLRLTQEIGVFDRDAHVFSELAKKTTSAATHSGLTENWKMMQETIATPVTGIWSPPKRRNPCSLPSHPSLLRALLFIPLSLSSFPLSALVSVVVCSVSFIQDDLAGYLPSNLKLPNWASFSVQATHSLLRFGTYQMLWLCIAVT